MEAANDAPPDVANTGDPSRQAAVQRGGPSNQPQSAVTRLHRDDILLGRGAPSAEYQGNARLREIVLLRRDDYMKTSKRKEKHTIAVEIVAQARANGGRFLRRIESAGELRQHGLHPNDTAYTVVEDQEILLNKVKQLLRDIGPEAKQKRAERRQERKRKRDNWHLPPVEEAPHRRVEEVARGGRRLDIPPNQLAISELTLGSASSVGRQRPPTVQPSQLSGLISSVPAHEGSAYSQILQSALAPALREALRQEEIRRQLLLHRQSEQIQMIHRHYHQQQQQQQQHQQQHQRQQQLVQLLHHPIPQSLAVNYLSPAYGGSVQPSPIPQDHTRLLASLGLVRWPSTDEKQQDRGDNKSEEK